MDMVERKILKAMDSLQRALDEYRIDKKRESVGSLDYVKENAQEAIWLIVNKIKEEREYVEVEKNN